MKRPFSQHADPESRLHIEDAQPFIFHVLMTVPPPHTLREKRSTLWEQDFDRTTQLDVRFKLRPFVLLDHVVRCGHIL